MKHSTSLAGWVCALLVLAGFGAASAQQSQDWRALITQNDSARLAGQAGNRSEIVAQARENGSVPDIRTMLRVLEPAALPIKRENIVGQWRCRSIQIGGDPFVTPYGFFNCQIEDTINGLVIHKTTGSQRFFGRLFQDGGRSMIYLGAQYLPIDGLPPGVYGADAQKDQVGRLSRISRTELRLEMPRPQAGGDYEVIHLVRSAPEARAK